MKRILIVLGVSFALLLAGCGLGSVQDVKARTEKLTTKEELENALGKPTKVSGGSAFGLSMEEYVYEASDGTVTFGILNGKIQTKFYGTKDTK